MRIHSAGPGRAFFALAVAALLALASSAGAEETEVIKGTVANIRPSALYLTDVGPPDAESASRDAMVALDDATEYYDATRRVSRDEIVPGLRVIVRVRAGSEGRTAAQVRIIGGKTS